MADSEANFQEFVDNTFVPEIGFYQPSSDETWEAYQALLTVVDSQTKVQLPREVLCGVADEVLGVLKSKNIPSPSYKKAEIEKILNPIPYFFYNQLASTANLIKDYHGSSGAAPDFYQPKSAKTWIPYKSLLDLINDQFGSELPDVVQCTLAHEVLVTLKDDSIDKSKKRDMIANTFDALSNQTFDALLSIGERITDFNDEAAAVEYMNQTPGPQYDFEFADDVFCDPDDDDDDDDLVLDPNSDSDVSQVADNEAQSSSSVLDPNSDSDVSEVADNEAQSSSSFLDPNSDSDVSKDADNEAQSSSSDVSEVADNEVQSSSSDDELRNLGFEKVRLGDNEDTEDWVVV